MLLGFTGFKWVLWVLLSLTDLLLGFTGFYWVLPGFTGFYCLWRGYYLVWLGCTVIFLVCTGLYGFSGGYSVWVGFTGLLPSFIESREMGRRNNLTMFQFLRNRVISSMLFRWPYSIVFGSRLVCLFVSWFVDCWFAVGCRVIFFWISGFFFLRPGFMAVLFFFFSYQHSIYFCRKGLKNLQPLFQKLFHITISMYFHIRLLFIYKCIVIPNMAVYLISVFLCVRIKCKLFQNSHY